MWSGHCSNIFRQSTKEVAPVWHSIDICNSRRTKCDMVLKLPPVQLFSKFGLFDCSSRYFCKKCSRELVTPVAPRWHVAMTASAPSAQGSVRDPLFFPHCLELSANLVQTYFLTSSDNGRQ